MVLRDKIDEKKQKEIESLKTEYDKKIKDNEERYTKELQSMYKEQGEILGKVRYYDQLLSNYAGNRVQVLRSSVISVLQGYTPESKVAELRASIESVEKELGEKFFIQVEDPSYTTTRTCQAPQWILNPHSCSLYGP